MKSIHSAAVGVTVLVCILAGGVGSADAIPIGWTCVGNCGTSGADGVVVTPPVGTTYEWVSTNGAGGNSGLGLGFNETNGSVLTTNQFQANAGDELVFYFNYVTSDGAGFPEYAWAQLLGTGEEFLLFTARTAENDVDNTVPGVDMPPLGAGVTLAPPIVPIIPGPPTWSPLGEHTNTCWAVGCGYTDWVQASFTIVTAGMYSLEFGVVNVNDQDFDSGMAIAGATIAGDPITTEDVPPTVVPEPATIGLIAFGLAGLAARRRRSKP